MRTSGHKVVQILVWEQPSLNEGKPFIIALYRVHVPFSTWTRFIAGNADDLEVNLYSYSDDAVTITWGSIGVECALIWKYLVM